MRTPMTQPFADASDQTGNKITEKMRIKSEAEAPPCGPLPPVAAAASALTEPQPAPGPLRQT